MRGIGDGVDRRAQPVLADRVRADRDTVRVAADERVGVFLGRVACGCFGPNDEVVCAAVSLEEEAVERKTVREELWGDQHQSFLTRLNL